MRAFPGDTVLVQPGLYREQITPPISGIPGAPIIYRAAAAGLEWDPRPEAVSYNLYRGDLGSLIDTDGDGAAESYGVCFASGLAAAEPPTLPLRITRRAPDAPSRLRQPRG